MENNKLKRCSICKKEKQLEDFTSDRSTKDLKRSQCKSCYNEKRKAYSSYNYANDKSERVKVTEKYWNNKSKERHDRIKKNRMKRQRIRMKSDKQFVINRRISNAFRKLLKIRGVYSCDSSWFQFVDYDRYQLQQRLLDSLHDIPGYTWIDYLNGDLHIDHIKPLSKFKFESQHDDEFKECWALDNLRLLPAKENMKKHAKYDD